MDDEVVINESKRERERETAAGGTVTQTGVSISWRQLFLLRSWPE